MENQTWLAQGKALAAAHKTHQWQIADWLLAGETLAPTDLYNVAEELFPQYSRTTFRVWVSVARAFPSVMRITQLTFTHHLAVMSASAPTVGCGDANVEGVVHNHDFICSRWYPECPKCILERESSEASTAEATAQLRAEWLMRAVANGWSVAALRLAIAAPTLAPVVPIGPQSIETPQEEETPAPVPERYTPTAVKEEDYRLPLTWPQKEKLAHLARLRGLTPTSLAAHAVAEYLEDHSEEVSAAAEQAAAQSKQAAETSARLHAAAKASLDRAVAQAGVGPGNKSLPLTHF